MEKDNINYCIVQELPTDKQHILGLLLSIELYDKQSICVICCTEETKTFIEQFPKNIELVLDFIIIDADVKLNCLTYIKNIFKSLLYCINKYGECLLTGKDLIMTNKIKMSNEIKTQKIGYIKKTINTPDEETEFQKYSIELFYIGDIEYVNTCIKYYETEFNCANFWDLCFDDYEISEINEKNKLCVKFYARLPLYITNQCNITHFLDKYAYIGSEDFFAYENSIKMTDISNNLSIEGFPIYFCNIRTATLDKNIQYLNNHFLNVLIKKHIVYMSLLNIKMSNNKLQLVSPNKNGVGIWNRTKDVGGIYELFDYFSENYSDYLTKAEVNIDYFSFGNFLLTDKPSHIWLNNSIKKYSNLFICNYDKSLIDILPSLPIPNTFLFYYSFYPKQLDAFLNANSISVERSIDYAYVIISDNDNMFQIMDLNDTSLYGNLDFNTFIEKLRYVKYAIVEKFNPCLLATFLALGVVPIVLDKSTPIYDLIDNIHYVTSIEQTYKDGDVVAVADADENYERLKNNGLNYYDQYIKPSSALNKLFNHIFIRQIE